MRIRHEIYFGDDEERKIIPGLEGFTIVSHGNSIWIPYDISNDFVGAVQDARLHCAGLQTEYLNEARE